MKIPVALFLDSNVSHLFDSVPIKITGLKIILPMRKGAAISALIKAIKEL